MRPSPAWMERFGRGDLDVMEQIYRDHFRVVSRSAGRILAQAVDRDAVVQDVFTDIIGSRRIREGFRGGDLSSWLVTIARNRALNVVRRERRLVSLTPSHAGQPSSHARPIDPEPAVLADVERFAQNLDERRRELMRLRFLEGLTQTETAARLGMPRSTAEDWEHRIRERLWALLFGDRAA